MTNTIIGLGLLFFLGHALNWFFTKTKIPDLLILVFLGYLLGPMFGVVEASDFGKVGGVISTMALIVILYEGGLHLSAKDLLRSSLPAAALSILGFLLISVITTLLAVGIGFMDWPISILLGVGVGSTSSAIVIPMVKYLSVKDTTKTVLSLESAFTDVLTIVIFLVLVEAFASGQFSLKVLALGIGPKTLQAALIGMASGAIWAFIKARFRDVVSMAFANEAWALLTYGCIEIIGFNGAIGVLALGFILANINLLPAWMTKQMNTKSVSGTDLSLLSEITFLLRTFFFIYLGTLVQFSNWQTVGIALLVTLAIFITRYLTVRLLFKPNTYSRLDVMVSVAMGPRGLACAVLATIPASRGIENGAWLQDVMFSLIPFSIFITAVFVSFSENASIRNKMGYLFGSYSDEPEALPEPTLDPTESTS